VLDKEEATWRVMELRMWANCTGGSGQAGLDFTVMNRDDWGGV